MDVNKLAEIKDGDATRSLILVEAPSILDMPKHKLERSVSVKKKRRRGKSKWKISKPYLTVPWQERRKSVNTKRNNRFRKLALSKTQAPFNNNQFLMEIHKPEPENNLYLFRTPSARTRESSFSVDSEDNYFYSLPEDEEEYLTKEFSSVYEDAQCERLSNMSKNELIQEYLILEAKYDNLVKRTERFKQKDPEDDKDVAAADKDMCATDADSVATDQDTSGASVNSGSMDESSLYEVLQRLKEQEQQIRELQMANEKLLLENSHLRHSQGSSEDSESDSSSSSDSCSSSSSSSPEQEPHDTAQNASSEVPNGNHIEENGVHNGNSPQPGQPVVNGFHSPTD